MVPGLTEMLLPGPPGAQLKLVAVGEVAVRVTLLPGHAKATGGVTVTVGRGFTVTVTSSCRVQPSGKLANMVYTVVLVGEAVGLAILGLDKPVVGNQEKLVAPAAEPVNPTDWPSQMVRSGPAFTLFPVFWTTTR